MRLNRGQTMLVVAAVGAGIVGAASALSPEFRSGITGAGPDLLSVMRARSPGDRAAGAQTNKLKLAEAQPVSAALPTSSVASERTPAAAALAPAVAPALPPAAVAPAPMAVPLAAAPATAAVEPAVLAGAPAASAGPGPGLALAGALLPIAAVALIGDGGGDDVDIDVTQPPPPGPAVPEPATWMMMITGIGFLGFALRSRRRRLTRQTASARFVAKAA